MTHTTKHTPGPITNNLAHDVGEFLLDRHDQFTHWCEDQYAYTETDIQTIVPKLKAAPAMYEALQEALKCIEKHVPKTEFAPRQWIREVLAQAEGGTL
jgi:ferritin-like metal-binding protein YciE